MKNLYLCTCVDDISKASRDIYVLSDNYSDAGTMAIAWMFNNNCNYTSHVSNILLVATQSGNETRSPLAI